MNDTAVRVSGLEKRYPTFALGPIDLAVPRGFVTGLVGANGSGKTTTLKAILGMVRPDAGRIEAPGRDRIGVVLDTPAYVREWRSDEVGRALAPFYPTWSAQRFGDLLASFGIPERTRVSHLSRGMGMKLQVAVALAHETDLLLFDEPTSGLDPLARSELMDLVAEYMTDAAHTVLFSTHITTDLDRIADHIIVLDKGRVAAAMPRDELIDSYRLVRGAADPLPDDLRPAALGLRVHDAGWDALLPTNQVQTQTLGCGAVVEPPTLDDIVVRFAKGH